MKLLLAAAAALALASAAYAQELPTFQETARVLVDRAVSGDVTASITLQTTSGQEILVPPETAALVRDDPRVLSVALTNKEGCGVLGVSESACILVNVRRLPSDSGISEIRAAARASGDRLAESLNGALETGAEFHSVYIHQDGGLGELLGTSGAVSGRGVVSAVYAMPAERTAFMYERITALLLDEEIRAAGGFYDAARTMSFLDGAYASFTAIKRDSGLQYMAQVAVSYPGAASAERVDLLEYAGVDVVYRSLYLDGGFSVLNSVFEVFVLSPGPVSVSAESPLLPVLRSEGEVLPLDVSSAGWVVDDTDPTQLVARYLFGQERSVSGDDLVLYISDAGEADRPDGADLLAPALIAAAAAGAALFYLKGYRSKK